MEVELMVTKRDDDDRPTTDRVNIEQSATGRLEGRVLQKVWRDAGGNIILGVSINQLCPTPLVMSLTMVFKITFCK